LQRRPVALLAFLSALQFERAHPHANCPGTHDERFYAARAKLGDLAANGVDPIRIDYSNTLG